MITRNLLQGGGETRTYEGGDHVSSWRYPALGSAHVRVRLSDLSRALDRLADLGLDQDARNERSSVDK